MSTQTKPERPRGRRKASESVPIDQILERALTAFATVGYDGMSLRTLNRELGVSHNLIHQRFGSKDELWRAAVDFGFGRMLHHMQGLFDPTLSEPLEQLRLAIRRFVMFSADNPELVALMNIEGRQDTDRLAYIYDNYIDPGLEGIARLLDHLAEAGVIRPVPLRTFHFLIAHGATAPYSLVSLATKFDPASPCDPAAVEAHARLVSTIVVDGLRVPR
ncbi:TetR/AcrR family transcriptional regulator [Rhodococcus opacus]|uniref:TetR/AcrR family transcriptional regulator n=1 Tax=Rhodococcus opacus TaxID=37919 RepID=UPI001C49155D|nr:TetR/AcrR family transcriptional regulator [Rhodococcus opacus]MBV6762309.1 TetR/AcrR family transcriptional regulator [Rhodococcus opacus]